MKERSERTYFPGKGNAGLRARLRRMNQQYDWGAYSVHQSRHDTLKMFLDTVAFTSSGEAGKNAYLARIQHEEQNNG